MPNRSTSERISDTLARLSSETNVWIATASSNGVPHLVPLSLAWYADSILVATPSNTPTARNVKATGRARASLDSAVDVVIIDAAAVAGDYEGIDRTTKAAYVSLAGWDPEQEAGDWSLITLTPRLVHAWRDASEIDGRTIMRRGAWSTD